MRDSWKDCTLGPIKPIADHNSSAINSVTRSTPSSLLESSRFILQAKYPLNQIPDPNPKKSKSKPSTTRPQNSSSKELERHSPLPQSKSVMSMEKTPQKPKMIRSGSGTKKKKSIEQQPVVVQGNTFRLNSRIEVLQNAIKNKEQRLNNLNRDLSHDKSNLDTLQRRLESKKTTERSSCRMRKSASQKKRPVLNEIEKEGLSGVHQKSKLQLIKMMQKASKSTQERVWDHDLVSKSVVIEKENSIQSSTDATYYTAGPEIMIKNKENISQNNSILDHKEEVSHQEKVMKLKEHLINLRKENLELKEEMKMQEDEEKLKLQQAYRIQELLEVLGNKEKELAKRENFYRGKIEDMGTKIIELNDQMEDSIKYQETLKKMAEQIKYKDIEISVTKDFFMNRVQNLIEEGITHENKREKKFSNLVKEVGDIRGKLNHSSGNKHYR